MGFPNKYPGDCSVCGQHVSKKEGVYEDGDVVCSTQQCIDEAGVEVPGDETRELRRDDESDKLVVDTPYEPNNLSLIKSMPDARFDGDRKVWMVSADPADRPRILEIADKLDLDIKDGLREYRQDQTTERLLEQAEQKGAYDFQLAGIEFLAANDRALLADDMGLGKTMQTILALPEDAAVLVTCPNSVKYVWRDEVAKWRGEDFEVTIPEPGEVRPPESGEIVVVNYNRLPGAIEDGWDEDDYDDHGVDLDGSWDEMAAREEFVLVGDEAHAFKNREAQRTRRFNELNDLSDKTWLLTGTPLPNRPLDLWGTLSAGDMAFKVFDFWDRFIDLFGGYKNRYGGYEFGTPKEEAGERLRRVMVKRDKEEVLDDLPSKTIQTITVNGVSDDLQRRLDELAAEFGDMLEAGSLPSFEEFSSARRRLAEARIPHAIEMVEEFEEQDRPLVVFSDHREPVETIGERDGWEAIHGGVNDEVRADRIEAFQNGDLDGLALTIGAGKEGITLTRASTMLFIDLSWVPGDNLQAEDRIRRIGQDDDNCHYIRLVSDHALDQHILNLLSWKMEVIDKGVDGELEGGAPEPDFELEPEEISDEVWEERVEAHIEEMEREQVRQQEREEVAEVMRWMLQRCDGAQTEDYQGFNGWDAPKARELVDAVPHSDGAAAYAKQMLRKYRDTQWGSRFDVDWYDEENGEAA